MRSKKIPTPATQKALTEIITGEFAGSQAKMAKATGLDAGALFRVVTGVRPATPELTGRVLKHVSKDGALRLLTAYLTDAAAATGADTDMISIIPRFDKVYGKVPRSP
jgi:hypothetical protein